MSIVTLLFSALVQADVEAPGGGPSGDPTNVEAVEYGGPPPKARIQWDNGDATAQTRIYDGAVLIYTALPGATSYNTGLTESPNTFYVAHYKDGVEGTQIEAVFGLD